MVLPLSPPGRPCRRESVLGGTYTRAHVGSGHSPCLPTYSHPLPLTHTYVLSPPCSLWSSHPLSLLSLLSKVSSQPSVQEQQGERPYILRDSPHLLSPPLPGTLTPGPAMDGSETPKNKRAKKEDTPGGSGGSATPKTPKSKFRIATTYYTFRRSFTRGALSYTHLMPLVPKMFAHSLQTLPPPPSRVPLRSFTASIGLRPRLSLSPRVPRLRSCLTYARASSCLVVPQPTRLNPLASPLGRPALQRLKRRRRPGRGTTVRWGC